MKTLEVSESFVRRAHSAACADWKREIEREFPGLFAKTYRIGQTFNNGEFLLAQVGNGSVCLIAIKQGNRHKDPIFVTDNTRITEDELMKIMGNSGSFHLDIPNNKMNERGCGSYISRSNGDSPICHT